MINPEQIAMVTLFTATSCTLWVLFFWLYRDYRLDYYREKLFSVRDELFDLADAGVISFDDPAYVMLRGIINGMISTGHRQGILSRLIPSLVLHDDQVAKVMVDFNSQWRKALLELDEETRKKIIFLQFKVHFLAIDQIIFTSSIMLFTMATVVVWLIIKHIGHRVFDLPWVKSVIEQLDATSLALSNETLRFDTAPNPAS